MLSLSRAFQEDNDKNVSLQVKVVDVLKTDKTTAGKEFLLVQIGDETGTAKMKVFKKEQFEKFQEMPYLLLQNVIKKHDLFIFTVKSIASYCKPVTVSTTPVRSTSAAAEGNLKQALDSPNQMTLKCRVVHVSPIKDRTNSYTGMPLKLKHLIAKDNTGTAKVALWNDLAKEEYHQNDIIRLSNMKGTTFEQKKLLGSTPNSKVEFIASEGTEMPDITEDDRRLALEDPDFKESTKTQGIIKGFDSFRVYRICPNKRCMNKEIIDGFCSSCNKQPDTVKKYMKATLTIQNLDLSEIKNLTLFYPDYCTLCAFLDLKTDLDETVVRSNLLTVVDEIISYTTRKTCIANITMKRKSSD